jgi:hypothetical protein
MKMLLALIAIIATLGMIGLATIYDVNAAPKEQKTTYHGKDTTDPETGEFKFKDGYNTNGPSGHQNCKTYSDSSGTNEGRCVGK